MKAAVNAQDPIINVLSEIFEHDPNVTHEQIILEAARIKAPPTTSVLRINTILTDSDNALKTAAKILLDQSPAFQVYRPSNLPNVLFVNSLGPYDPQPFKRQAMVSRECAQAVLRGSHVFSPGIIAIQDDTSEEDQVSVWADLDGKCTRGYRLEYLGAKKFVGNGILKMSRKQLFTGQAPKGIAIEVKETEQKMPSFSDFPKDLYFPQNLPSILVIEELAPEPGQIILDMCASPGGKSSHAAIKMNNRGLLLALDKNETKVVKLQATLAQQNITSARAYAADSSKLASASQDEGCIPENFIGKGEKIKPNSFDSVILDPPCSGIGQRPVIPSSSFLPQTKGFSQYQKRLLSQAVALVKSNGLIAYSTCTLVPEENEGVIAHAVQDLGLVLECPKFSFGDRGLEGHGLSKDDCLKVKRFWPGGPDDSIAFFYAILRKP